MKSSQCNSQAIAFPDPINGSKSHVPVVVAAVYNDNRVSEYSCSAKDIPLLCGALEKQCAAGLLKHYTVTRAGAQRTPDYFGFAKDYQHWIQSSFCDKYFDTKYRLAYTGVVLNMLESASCLATPGPWYNYSRTSDGGGRYNALQTEEFDEIFGECGLSNEDARFIASANPQVVRELIDLARIALRCEYSALSSDQWQYVPKNATEAMMHAAEDVPSPRPYGAVWRAMIGAAPSSHSLNEPD